jgi:hypothetical protein
MYDDRNFKLTDCDFNEMIVKIDSRKLLIIEMLEKELNSNSITKETLTRYKMICIQLRSMTSGRLTDNQRIELDNKMLDFDSILREFHCSQS